AALLRADVNPTTHQLALESFPGGLGRDVHEIDSTCDSFSAADTPGWLWAGSAFVCGEILPHRPQRQVSLFCAGIGGTESSRQGAEGLNIVHGTGFLRSGGAA